MACVECHGRIDTMPLTQQAKPFQMQFCIDCHQDPAPHLRPPDKVTQMAPLSRSAAAAIVSGGTCRSSRGAVAGSVRVLLLLADGSGTV